MGWDQWGLLADVTNQYVVAGIHGGLWGLLLFLATLGTAFYGLARELLVTKDQHDHALAWYLMIIFVGILAAFFGLSFFGQLSTFWYLHFAMIAYLCEKREIEKRSLKHQQTTGNGPVCL